MTYYQVLPQFDNYRLPKRLIYIQNELFTPAEVKRYNVDVNKCQKVQCSRKKTYFFFGARFPFRETGLRDYNLQTLK